MPGAALCAATSTDFLSAWHSASDCPGGQGDAVGAAATWREGWLLVRPAMAFMTKGVGVGTDEAGAAGSVVTAATSGAGCAAGTSVGIAGGVTEVSEGLAGSHAIGSPHKPNITLIKPLANRTATEIKATKRMGKAGLALVVLARIRFFAARVESTGAGELAVAEGRCCGVTGSSGIGVGALAGSKAGAAGGVCGGVKGGVGGVGGVGGAGTACGMATSSIIASRVWASRLTATGGTGGESVKDRSMGGGDGTKVGQSMWRSGGGSVARERSASEAAGTGALATGT